MEFTVPQFIEKEAKIVGPLTFKQFIFIGIAGGLSIFLFFTVPFPVFIILAIILLGGAFALAFLNIERTSLPIYIKNFFYFIFKPRIYLWRKKYVPPKLFKREGEVVKVEEDVKKEPTLKIAKESKLGELFTRLETKPK